VQGAAVWLATPADAWLPPEQVVTTDAEGRFQLYGPTDLSSSWIYVRADGHRCWEAHAPSVTRDDTRFAIELESKASIEGMVVDIEGSPLQGVVVQARGPDAETLDGVEGQLVWPQAVRPDRAEGRSDAAGRFRLQGLDEAEYELSAWMRGHAAVDAAHGSPLRVRASVGGSVPTRLELEPLYEVRVHAVDAGTGSRLPWACLEVGIIGAKPWSHAAVASEELGAEDSRYEGSVHVRLYRHDRRGDTRTTIRVTARAPGFEEATLHVVPERGGAIQSKELRLQRLTAADLVPVWFRLEVSGTGVQPSGTFALTFLDGAHDGSGFTTPIDVAAGTSTRSVPLPEGTHSVRIMGVSGSAALWKWPMGRESVQVEVRGGGDQVATLPCQGLPLRVRPRDRTGQPMLHFRAAVRSQQGYAQFAATPENLGGRVPNSEHETSERIFWIAPLPSRLTIGKPGYVSTTLDVTPDTHDLSAVYEPVLVRATAPTR
jgi:hypothetical protein